MAKEKAAIVACHEIFTDPRKGEWMTELEMSVKCAKLAIESSGLDKNDIDAIFAPRGDWYRPQINNVIAQELKIAPRISNSVTTHGAGSVGCLKWAALTVMSGLAKYALVATGSVHRPKSLESSGQQARKSRGMGEGGMRHENDVWYEVVYGPVVPSNYALIAQRYVHEFGVKPEEVARLAVEERKWALTNRYAGMYDKGPITVDDVVNSPMIVSPLHLLDCALYSNKRTPGQGGALIITTPERAKKLTDQPIYILGCGECSTHDNIAQRLAISSAPTYFPEVWNTLTTTGAAVASKGAYEEARLGPEDIDVACICDTFAHIGLINIEDCGFSKKGEACKDLAEGKFNFDGGKPAINTHGGYLSFGQAGHGLRLISEVVQQMRGTPAGKRVENCNYGLVQVHGGMTSCQQVCILGTKVPSGA